MVMFEYKIVFLDDVEMAIIDLTLNKFGKEGWRLHTISKPDHLTKTKVLLERKVGDG